MVAKGVWAHQSPLVPNDSDENRALNRRVELTCFRIRLIISSLWLIEKKESFLGTTKKINFLIPIKPFKFTIVSENCVEAKIHISHLTICVDSQHKFRRCNV